MIILSIDSSTPVASVAVIDDTQLLGEYTINTQNTHSEKLMTMIVQLLGELTLTMQDVTAVAVAQGPGSFTGLRIGMATAKGLVQGSGKRLIAVPSLDSLAYNLLGYDGLICPILNAKKNEVYTALYRGAGESLVQIKEPFAIKPAALAELLQQYPEKIWFLGDGVPVFGELLRNVLAQQANFAPIHQTLSRAASLALLALERAKAGQYDALYSVLPIYIRKSEAEVQWEAKNKTSID